MKTSKNLKGDKNNPYGTPTQLPRYKGTPDGLSDLDVNVNEEVKENYIEQYYNPSVFEPNEKGNNSNANSDENDINNDDYDVSISTPSVGAGSSRFSTRSTSLVYNQRKESLHGRNASNQSINISEHNLLTQKASIKILHENDELDAPQLPKEEDLKLKIKKQKHTKKKSWASLRRISKVFTNNNNDQQEADDEFSDSPKVDIPQIDDNDNNFNSKYNNQYNHDDYHISIPPRNMDRIPRPERHSIILSPSSASSASSKQRKNSATKIKPFKKRASVQELQIESNNRIRSQSHTKSKSVSAFGSNLSLLDLDVEKKKKGVPIRRSKSKQEKIKKKKDKKKDRRSNSMAPLKMDDISTRMTQNPLSPKYNRSKPKPLSARSSNSSYGKRKQSAIEILRSNNDEFGTFKILLLGTSNSGKTTIFKQLQEIFGDGFDERQKKGFRISIYEQILDSLIEIIDQIEEYAEEHNDEKQNDYFINYNDKGTAKLIDYLQNKWTANDIVRNLKNDQYIDKIKKYLKLIWGLNGVQKMYKYKNI